MTSPAESSTGLKNPIEVYDDGTELSEFTTLELTSDMRFAADTDGLPPSGFRKAFDYFENASGLHPSGRHHHRETGVIIIADGISVSLIQAPFVHQKRFHEHPIGYEFRGSAGEYRLLSRAPLTKNTGVNVDQNATVFFGWVSRDLSQPDPVAQPGPEGPMHKLYHNLIEAAQADSVGKFTLRWGNWRHPRG